MTTRLTYPDHRADPAAWAHQLGISQAAVELYLASEVIDLHWDTYLWYRLARYDPRRRHGRGLLGARLYSHVDFPRLREACIGGAMWVISTNVWRRPERRAQIAVENLRRLQGLLECAPTDIHVARTAGDYRAARAAGRHAAFLAIQGGNAFDVSLDALDLIPDNLVLRITLVHLSSSRIGVTSSPLAGSRTDGLSAFGHDFVRRLNEKRVFVDLAHINRAGFFDAVRVHDPSQPLLVTHTGVAGVHRHWRNIDDEQLRAVADTGGVVGVMYHSPFLGDPYLGGRAETIVRHLAHIIDTVGEDHAALGSDWDGMINPPRDLLTVLELPRLVEVMLRRGWNDARVRKILGGNFLRALAALRG
jgi:membrane dipeptidase